MMPAAELIGVPNIAGRSHGAADGLESIRIFDTTLRDGEQSPGCALTPPQKLVVARQLALLAVDVIEAGFPAASESEIAAVASISDLVGRSTTDGQPPIICALARANRADIDLAARALTRAQRPRIHTFIATSERHMARKLRLSPGEVLERVDASVRHARTLVDDVEFSPEDATRSDPDFLIAALRTAIDAGATTLNIPDTVGYATPDEYGALIARVCRLARMTPGVIVSTHCHDDLGLAVANSLEGVRAGARQVECTINALGERAGNASLEEIVMAIQTRPTVFRCRTQVNTREIVRSSRLVSDLTGVAVPPNKAIVGANAFAHESGIHQDGVLKDRDTYEIMSPECVGADGSRLVLGKHSGRNALKHRLETLGYHLTASALAEAFDQFKGLADASTTTKEIDDDMLHDMMRASRADVARNAAAQPRTMFEKLWNAHLVRPATASTPAVLYVDLHLVHEVTSAQAFAELQRRGRSVRRPQRTVATMDHSTPTTPPVWTHAAGRSQLPLLTTGDPEADVQLETLASNCRTHGIELFPLGHERQGIVHVIGPELGLTQPGMTVVCGDSHTSTHGAFGALAFGIGTSQVGHVLATQCVLQTPSRVFEIRVDGMLGHGVTAKDLILAIIAQIGVDGATGFVVEYRGSAIRALSMEARMTVCNMSIEAGARAGMIAPDDVTFEYLVGRRAAPVRWDDAVRHWRTLPSDDGATFDRSITINADAIEPMITFGTNPGMAIPITQRVPDPIAISNITERTALERALGYMDMTPGSPLIGRPVDTVFLGSCTNSRLSDLRAAAALLRGAKVAHGVRMLVVPGSSEIKRAAEAEGLDRVFREAGAEWREAGCSMCIAMNGDRVGERQLAVSTSNRNFEGRQGPGARTLLASPLTAAASAIAGAVADPRPLLPR